MALDLGQGQVGNVAHQGFEAFVFADPLLNLREQILGDINGTGFALYFEGQVIGQVAFTGLAVAAGAAALSLEGDQAGSDEEHRAKSIFKDAGAENITASSMSATPKEEMRGT